MSAITHRTFVYAIGTEDGPVKIGITQNICSRLRTLQNGSPHKLELIFVHTFDCKDEARKFEQWFHRCISERRLAGEWFNISANDAYDQFDLLVTQKIDFRHLDEEWPDREGPTP